MPSASSPPDITLDLRYAPYTDRDKIPEILETFENEMLGGKSGVFWSATNSWGSRNLGNIRDTIVKSIGLDPQGIRIRTNENVKRVLETRYKDKVNPFEHVGGKNVYDILIVTSADVFFALKNAIEQNSSATNAAFVDKTVLVH